MTADTHRRPLASRDACWAKSIARFLAGTGLTPNQISMASMGAAALAGLALWAQGQFASGSRPLLLILAASFCQLRLLCNLFDGMVAIEGGKRSPDGAFWNEFPDRVADLLVFVGAGYGVGVPALGWAAAAVAILTAYVRELGRACGLASDFSGPMAKQHRMALVTSAALLSLCDPLWQGDNQVLFVALWVIVVGSGVTVARRSIRLLAKLRAEDATIEFERSRPALTPTAE